MRMGEMVLGMNRALLQCQANLTLLSQPPEPNDSTVFPLHQFKIRLGLMFVGRQVFSALASTCQSKCLKNPFLAGLSRMSSCHGNVLANNWLSTSNFSSAID